MNKMEILRRFFSGVNLPPLSMSLEDGKIIFSIREKKKIKNYFIEDLNKDIVKIEGGEWKMDLEEGEISKILRKIKSQNLVKFNKMVLLIPDFLTNAFVLSFENLPKNKREVENLIKWRMEKQFPSKGELILRYNIFRHENEIKVLTISVPKSLIQNISSILNKSGLEAPFISVPILTLYNFIREISSSKNLIIVNRLLKGTSIFGSTPSSAVIFRSKIGNLTKREVIEETISTMKWMQDKENVKTDEIWIRDISEERWDDLEKPFIPITSLENKIKDIKFLAPHLGIPEWTE